MSTVIEKFLINLDRSQDRLVSSQLYLSAAGISFVRVAAVDGRSLSLDRLKDYSENMARTTFGRTLTLGELGCFLSHIKCAEAFLKSGAKYGLVLEDDLKCETNLGRLLDALTDFLETEFEKQWHVINLGNNAMRFFSRCGTITDGPEKSELCIAHFFPKLTTALLWSREGARCFLASCLPIYAPVDTFLRDWCTKSQMGLIFVNPIVTTTGVGSLIDGISSRKNERRESDGLLSRLRRLRRNCRNYLLAMQGMLKYRINPKLGLR